MDSSKLAITIGRGRKRPRGRLVPFVEDVSPARALLAILDSQKETEAWWSQHTWKDNHRNSPGWLSASAVGVDMDYRDLEDNHVAPPPELATLALQCAMEGKLPGSLFHLTPRGFRLVFMFPAPVVDRDVYQRTARGCGALAQQAVRQCKLLGYTLDEGALLDFARFLYSPRAAVDGIQRDAELLVLRDEPFDPVKLQPPPSKPRLAPALTFDEGARRYNQEHEREWPKHTGDCPGCGHKECFGRLPSDPSRWACFSTNHMQPGVKGPGCHHGDALDLDAHAAGMKPAELLRRGGYLSQQLLPATQQKPEQQIIPGTAQSPEQVKLIGISKGYASLCSILRNDRRVVPEPIEWNEMLCGPTVGGEEMQDSDTGRIRERIELVVKDSKQQALRFGSDDVHQAVLQVSHEKRYHPVREYLEDLEWDGIERISAVAEDVLGIEKTPIHLAMLRRFFISAVARIFQPGCEMHTVLILVGPQGAGKSRFFKTLTGTTWFSDARIDLENKDALMLLQKVWILEWAELAAMQRAKDLETVKAFITSTDNDFRQPYGRVMVRAKRHCIIVGTSNKREILNDPTGNRRYHPIRIAGRINLALVAEWRDQLWAEAVRLHRAGEQWHLTDDEELLLLAHQEQFKERDPWEEKVLDWCSTTSMPLTTSNILENALRKPPATWTRADENKVGRIMRTLYEKDENRVRDANGDKGPRIWKRRASCPI